MDASQEVGSKDYLAARVTAKCAEIRDLKSTKPKPAKEAIMSLVEELKRLKLQYEKAAGEPWGQKGAGARRTRAHAAVQAQQLHRCVENERGRATYPPAELTAAGVGGGSTPELSDRPVEGEGEGEGEGVGEQEARCYSTTANPENRENVDLYRSRFRQTTCSSSPSTTLACVSRQQQFFDVYANTDWPEKHRHLLNEMDVVKFVIDPAAQRLLHNLQVALVDKPYCEFGKTDHSWAAYTLMFRNGWPSRDNRKPVTDLFQQYCEDVYLPIVCAFLFGRAGWDEISEYWSTFKSCTIKVMDNTSFYGVCPPC